MQRLLSKWFTLTGMNHSFELTHQMDRTFNAPVEKIVTSVDDVRGRFPAISKSKFRFTLIEGFSKWKPENSVIELCFFKAIHLPGGSFIYWAHVTSLTCKANVQPTNTTSHTWITRRRVHLNRNSVAKSPWWQRVANLWTSDTDLLWFAAIHSLQDLAIFMAPHGQTTNWTFCENSMLVTFRMVHREKFHSCSSSHFFNSTISRQSTLQLHSLWNIFQQNKYDVDVI